MINTTSPCCLHGLVTSTDAVASDHEFRPVPETICSGR